MRVSASTVMKYRLSCIRPKDKRGVRPKMVTSHRGRKTSNLRTWVRLFVTPTGSLFFGEGRGLKARLGSHWLCKKKLSTDSVAVMHC